MKKVVCAGLLVLILGAVSVYSAETSTFTGLVISTSDTSIQIKKKNKELTLYWTEASKVTREGKESDRGVVQICQKVKATYILKDEKREIVQLDILKESYCFE